MGRSLNQVPLNALRAFEAAARLGSFNEAARELGVTPSAISLQIRRLEERIGRPLFARGHRAIELSETGRRLAPGMIAAFDGLEKALAGVIEPSTASLRISTMSSFANRWLAPRLTRFAERYPQYQVRVAGDDALIAFDHDDVDVGVRYGSGDYPKLFREKLADAQAFPVCSPAFAQRHAEALATPLGLARLTLLEDEIGDVAPGLPTWDGWFALAGVERPAGAGGVRFESQHMALAAAEAGQGVALGLTPLVDDALAAGTLVRPFALAAPSAHAFWVVCRRDRAGERKLAAFRRWILEEMGR